MEDFYQICKAFTDPVLIIFILLLASFVFCLMSSSKKNGLLIFGLSIVLLYGLSTRPASNFLAYQLEKDYLVRPNQTLKNIDAVVVLGGGVNDVQQLNDIYASEASSARLMHAIEIFNKYGARYFVCAGKGSARISEAEVMAQRAVALGVPKEKIKIDAKSNNTFEHAIEFNKMFKGQNISIGVVTSGYHMKRSEKEFKKYFKNVFPFPASYSHASSTNRKVIQYIPQTEALSGTTGSLREFIGLVWYEIRSI